VACSECGGRGRTNHLEQVMLPAGEWPHWCAYCHGGGKIFCSRRGCITYYPRPKFIFLLYKRQTQK